MYLQVVTNRHLCSSWKDFFARMEDLAYALKQGDRIILREPDLSPKEYLELAENCREILLDSPARLSLYGHLDLARKMKLRHLNLNMTDFLESTLPEDMQVSVSVQSVEDALLAERNGAKSLIAGQIFQSNYQAGDPPKGLDYLTEVCHAVHIPVFAIGGISLEKAPLALQAGAKGVCVMSEFMTCDDVAKSVKQFKKLK